MHIVGILGGIASGKSFVTNYLRDLGAGVLDADQAGHEVLRTPEVASALRRKWGETIIGPDGHIDRRKLAAVVFAPPADGTEARKHLEQLTHPAIERSLRQQAERFRAEGCPAIVLDAALLLEAGWDKLCDRLVFVDTPREQRLARARCRGWSDEEFDAREAAQKSLEFKRRRADVTIENSGSPEAARAQLERFWHSLVG